MKSQLKPNKLYYLASPYSGTKKLEKHRLEVISKVGGLLTEKKIHCIMPISSSATVNKYHKMDGSFETWRDLDLLYVERCDGIIVANLKGWRKSIGVLAEIEHAKALKKEIYILNSKDLLENNKLNIRKV